LRREWYEPFGTILSDNYEPIGIKVNTLQI
jgi:hypothetical protein